MVSRFCSSLLPSLVRMPEPVCRHHPKAFAATMEGEAAIHLALVHPDLAVQEVADRQKVRLVQVRRPSSAIGRG